MAYVPPTPKMSRFLLNLARDRALPALGEDAEARVTRIQSRLDERTLDKFQAMRLIDELKAAPLDRADGITPGVYQRNGEVFVVKPNRARTALYAKRLVEIAGQRLNEDDERVQIEFEYAPGALQTLRPSDQMSLEDAKPFLLRYGRCMVCRALLKDATSVEHAVGPVCVRMFSDYEAYQAARRVQPKAGTVVTAADEDRLRDLVAQLDQLKGR